MYVPTHQELGNHPKLRRLARTLAISRPAAVGHLLYLWWWSQDYAPDGVLRNSTGHPPEFQFTSEDIADAALWEGDADAFLDALMSSGFLDDMDGRLVIHDWEDYGGKVVHERATDRERKRRKALERKAADIPEASSGHPADIQRTSKRSPMVDKIKEEEIREDKKRREKDAPNGAADEPPVLSDRQVKHRAMYAALGSAFGEPAPGEEKGRYESAAKALVTAGADPAEIPHLQEAWPWVNPGVPRVNSLASQLTILRNAQPPAPMARASPNGHAPITFQEQIRRNNAAADEQFMAIVNGATHGRAGLSSGDEPARRRLSDGSDAGDAGGVVDGTGAEGRRAVP